MWDENINSLNSFEENMKKGLKLFHFLGLFKNKAIEITKEIVDSFVLPEQSRKYHPIQSKQSISNNIMTMEHTYFITNPNFIVKLAWPESIQSNFFELQSSELYHNSNNSLIYSANKLKALGHGNKKYIFFIKIYIFLLEYRAYDTLSDVLFLLKKKNKGFNIRVPLTSLIEYKGIRSLVISQPPINITGIGLDTLAVGPLSSGDYRFNQILAPDLLKISTELNLKPHKFEWDPRMKSFPVFLSVFTEIHHAKQEEWDDLKSIYIPSIPGADLENVQPLSNLTNKQNQSPFPNNIVQSPPLYYVSKVADVFPVDIDISSKDPTFFIRRLR